MKKNLKKILVLLLLPLMFLFVSCGVNFTSKNPLLPDTGISKNIDKTKTVETSSNDTSTLNAIKQPNKEKYKVSHVIDGDTVSVFLKNGKKQSIRLYGIDTPETLKPTNKNNLAKLENLYAQRAKEYLNEIVKKAGNELLVQKISEDKYNRIVAIIYTSDGKNINNDLVRNGKAMVYYITNTKKGTFYTKTDFQKEYLKVILNSQQQARNDKLGFWQEAKLSDVFNNRSNIDFQ